MDIQRPKAYLIIDGQWGSCGKGLLAGYLARQRKPDLAVCNFGPNAGHTFIHGGHKIVTRQLPSAVVHGNTNLLLGPGAVINPLVLLDEIGEHQCGHRLMIHPNAAVVTKEDLDMEAEAMGSIASTKKGVGSAMARRLLRVDMGHVRVASEHKDLRKYVISHEDYRAEIDKAHLIQIESAQGLELSLTHGISYPYCTSRDITPEAILNDVGVPMRMLLETCVVLRTLPIRVGNEVSADGVIVGTSGPVFPDMREMTWDEVSKIAGQTIEERTTVTNKVRRVFSWSWAQYSRMLWHFGPCNIMLNFMNYMGPEVRSHSTLSILAAEFLRECDSLAIDHGSKVQWLGFGPGEENVEEVE